ncbi:MAG: hypothetical protein ACYDH6_23805 [Acidimicrobiales bacterium]
MRSARPVVASLGLALLCAACVHQSDPSVQVDALQADIVFGLRPKQAPIAPPPAQPPQVNAVGPVAVPPDQGQSPFSLPVDLGTLAASDCPSAALDAFPDKTAPVDVTTMPSVGQYRWQLGGGRSRGLSITPISGRQQRLVRRVTPIAKISTDMTDSIDYTFQVLQPFDTNGSVLAITYQVRTDNSGQRFVQAITGTTATAYVTTPDSGMSVIDEQVIDRSGGATTVFHPAQPFLILPLPIQPGGQFTTVAADPTTGQVTTLQATVLRRARVDACGTIIEGWEVAGLQKLTTVPSVVGPSPSQAVINDLIPLDSAIDNVYATQFGAMPIAEHTLTASVTGGAFTVDDAIGQEKPSPLPPGTA